MPFVKKTWKPGERVVPQLTASQLQRLEDAIADLETRVATLESP